MRASLPLMLLLSSIVDFEGISFNYFHRTSDRFNTIEIDDIRFRRTLALVYTGCTGF
jgi:hypothetical protein